MGTKNSLRRIASVSLHNSSCKRQSVFETITHISCQGPGGTDFSVGYLAMMVLSILCLLVLLLQNVVVSLHNLSIFVMQRRQIFT